MHTKTAIRFAVVLCVALTFVAVESRLVPMSVCDVGCVQIVYNTYCGGATCTYGNIDLTQRDSLCTRRCMDALSGKALFSCLKSGKMSDATSKSYQQELMFSLEGTTSSSLHISPSSYPASVWSAGSCDQNMDVMAGPLASPSAEAPGAEASSPSF